jgi:hypothetical protein
VSSGAGGVTVEAVVPIDARHSTGNFSRNARE